MRFYRRNADVGRRRLERAAAAGDAHAQSSLLVSRVRTGSLPIRNLWFSAILGDEAAARVVSWGPPKWAGATTYVFAFLDRDGGKGVLLPSPHPGSWKRVPAPWPGLTARQQHRFATAFAWACAASVRGIAVTGLQLLTSAAANAPQDAVPDDWDGWARDPSWRDLVGDNVEAMVSAARSCAFGLSRNLRTLGHRIRSSWGGDTPRDLHYMIQGTFEGEYYTDPPPGSTLNTSAWEHAEPWSDMAGSLGTQPYPEAGETERMLRNSSVAGLAGYLSALSAVRACASRINSKAYWTLSIPVSGWLRDADLGGITGRYSDAAGFASSAYVYASSAWSMLRTGTLQSPEGQRALQGPIRHMLIPPLLEGRL